MRIKKASGKVRIRILPALSILLLAPITFIVVYAPGPLRILTLGICVAVVLIITFRNWQRLLAVSIIALSLGSSNVGVFDGTAAPISAPLLCVLLLSAFYTNYREESSFSNGTHRLAMQLMWLLVILAALSILFSVDQLHSLALVLALVALTATIHRTSTTRWQKPGYLVQDMIAIYWSLLIVLGLGVILVLLGVDGTVAYGGDGSGGRWQGLSNNPNALGTISAITTGLGVGVTASTRSLRVSATLLLPLSQVFLSGSRTALIALILGLLVAIVRSGFIKAVVAVCCIIVLYLVSVATAWDPFGFESTRFVEDDISSLNGRTHVWSSVVEHLCDNYFGVGWGATSITLPEIANLASTHSSYLQLLFELGWVGMVPLIIMVFLFLRIIISSKSSGMEIGLVSAVVTVAIILLGESIIFGFGILALISWLLIVAATIGNTPTKPSMDSCRKPMVTAP